MIELNEWVTLWAGWRINTPIHGELQLLESKRLVRLSSFHVDEIIVDTPSTPQGLNKNPDLFHAIDPSSSQNLPQKKSVQQGNLSVDVREIWLNHLNLLAFSACSKDWTLWLEIPTRYSTNTMDSMVFQHGKFCMPFALDDHACEHIAEPTLALFCLLALRSIIDTTKSQIGKYESNILCTRRQFIQYPTTRWDTSF